MAVTAKVFGKAIASIMNKEVDWDTDTIKCALFTDAHAPDQDTDQYYDVEIAAATPYVEVANGDGYTTGGVTLSNKTSSYTAGTDVYMFDNTADIQWTTASFTARYAVIYDATPGSNKPMLCYIDFGQNETCSSGNFTITPHTDGLFSFDVTGA
jgi:hypothetical protein